MFDTHCHLNFEAFNDNVGEIIDAAKKVGVTRFVVPGTDLPTSKKAIEIAQQYDGVYAAVGIHPHHAFSMNDAQSTKHVAREIRKLETLIISCVSGYILHDSSPIVAIGEIGLDRYEYKKTKYEDYQIGEEFISLQKELFIAQLKLAVKYNLSVIVHNREAKKDTLQVLEENWDEHFMGRLVIHCCEPDEEILQFVIDHKIFLGVDGDLTYNVDKQHFIKKVPLENLVLETDSPFLSPHLRPANAKAMAGQQGFGGQATPLKFPNTPSSIPIIAKKVAELKGVTIEEVGKMTTENAKKLFNLP